MASQSLLSRPTKDAGISNTSIRRRASVHLPDRFREEEEQGDVQRLDRLAGGDRTEACVHQSMYGIFAGASNKPYYYVRPPLGDHSEPEREGQSKPSVHQRSGLASQQEYHRITSSNVVGSDRLGHDTSFRVINKDAASIGTAQHIPNDGEPELHHPFFQSQILPTRSSAAKNLRSPNPSLGSDNVGHDKSSIASASTHEQVEVPPSFRSSKTLPDVLAQIFSFDEPEEILSEYACWYLQISLLQGHMYVTPKHVCFYAYLPRQDNVVKSSYLGKRGTHQPRYRRYWFTLKNHVLSYYASASEPYSPSGTIDLRNATSAELASGITNSAETEVSSFTISTSSRVHYLRAESASSAKEWVRKLQKVILSCQTGSDSVKIVIPLDKIVDVESASVLDNSDTVKIRTVDDEETFAIDEYLFTFNTHGPDATNTLSHLAHRANAERTAADHADLDFLRSKFQRSQRLLPKQAGRESVSRVRPERRGSEASTSEPNSDSEGGEESEQNEMSASQMLDDDKVFGKSTLGSLQHRGKDIAVPQSTVAPRQPPTSELVSTWSRPASAGSTSLQQALSLADAVRTQSKRMGSYLSSSPKGYYDRFSDAIAGGKRNYSEADEPLTGSRGRAAGDIINAVEHEKRFQVHFALPSTEKLRSSYYCWLHRVLPLYGKIYISDRRLCFRSLLYGTRTKLVIPYSDIDNISKEGGFRFGYPGLVLVIRGHEELFFDFNSKGLRDDCAVTILRGLEAERIAPKTNALSPEDGRTADAAAAENRLLEAFRRYQPGLVSREQPRGGDVGTIQASSIFFDDPNASVLDFRPKEPLRITCLTIGSRGDVQPYIALCKRLRAHGHQTRIATHAEFEAWIQGHGIGFAAVEGDPHELMRICVENGMFTPSFVYETHSFARGWMDKLLTTSWKACQNSDLLIESPSAMAGIHIAEALSIPYFRAFGMPWTKTRAYPHAFANASEKMGGQYNYMTYVLFENFFWQFSSGQINHWRRETLGLNSTDLSKLQPNKVPFLYNFSPSVVAPPLDFSDWVRVTGYWFLDEASDWKPPRDLQAFIARARADNMKLVYIGFGSVPTSHLKEMTQTIVDAVNKADVRCIFAKGWSDHFDKKDPLDASAPSLPSAIFQIRSAPHDWLFKQVDAAVHHGGCGTTGASLRVGLPTVIKPFFGDQFFFAARVEDLGVGLYVRKLTVNSLGKAIWLATHDERVRDKAQVLARKIGREDGVETAINAIYRDLEYAKSLIKRRGVQSADADDEGEEEGSWTFVENSNNDDDETTASCTTWNKTAGFEL